MLGSFWEENCETLRAQRICQLPSKLRVAGSSPAGVALRFQCFSRNSIFRFTGGFTPRWSGGFTLRADGVPGRDHFFDFEAQCGGQFEDLARQRINRNIEPLAAH